MKVQEEFKKLLQNGCTYIIYLLYKHRTIKVCKKPGNLMNWAEQIYLQKPNPLSILAQTRPIIQKPTFS